MLKPALAILLLAVFACNKGPTPLESPFAALLKVPEGFPPVDYPEDNAFSVRKWHLGKKLFYDPVMSVDSSISCGSCHSASLAFSDNIPFSIGAGGLSGRRNSPSLANVAYHPYFTREGGVPTLEMQILVPIQEHDEFNFNIVEIAERLKQDETYSRLSQDAFDREPDHYVITRAIATFERSLISGNSTFDRNELSADEQQGKELFFSSKTKCSTCHGGFNFTNYAFENNGLYENYADVGRFRFTSDSSDIARFKVPGLRNIELTAPYMHDGSLVTLEQVVEHYNAGGAAHPNKNEVIQPLQLTATEKDGLVSFLRSLTDHEFVNNPNFQEDEK